jgi:DNA-binding response OmpR family regulator
VLEANMEFLQKPFTPNTLAIKVRAVLGASMSERQTSRQNG